jgi:hypothetical protein
VHLTRICAPFRQRRGINGIQRRPRAGRLLEELRERVASQNDNIRVIVNKLANVTDHGS